MDRGIGNFQNDSSNDYLYILFRKFEKDMNIYLNPELDISDQLDSMDETIMSYIEMLKIYTYGLIKSEEINRMTAYVGSDFDEIPFLPNVEKISKWKRLYLQGHDELMQVRMSEHGDEIYHPDKNPRRAVIVKTFDDLIELSEKYGEDGDWTEGMEE